MPMIIPVNIGEESTTLYWLAVAGGWCEVERRLGGGGASGRNPGRDASNNRADRVAIGVASGWRWWRCEIGSKCW
jgi:hypothetical protein